MKKNFLSAVCFLLLILSAIPGFGQNTQILKRVLPPAARVKMISHVTSTDIDLVIGLPFRNQADLTREIKKVSDPKSPQFRHYLTPAQFNAAYSPPPADYQALLDFVKSNGLTTVMTFPNRRLVHVRAPASVIEQVFHVTMNFYQHPIEKRMFYAPADEPRIDLKLPILYITGLDNYEIPHPIVRTLPIERSAHPTDKDAALFFARNGSGINGSFNGRDFRPAYVPGTSLSGDGQTIGLLQFDGYFPADIRAYESEAGLPSVFLQNVYLNGFTGIPSKNNVEVSLDIEMAAAMAPKSRIVVYGAAGTVPDAADLLNEMANPTQGEPLPNQISTSWAIWYDQNAYNAFMQMAMQGQTFFAASGDAGAYADNSQSPGPLPFPPADYAYVTCVGGTSLSLTAPGGARQSEIVWPGSGGGPSPWFPIPDYQQGMDVSVNHGSSTVRNCPDVAMPADNIEIVFGNGQKTIVGGTSAAAPLWAGFMALVNQKTQSMAKPPVGFLNPILYSIGRGASYSNYFHDITSGSNSNNGNTNKYSATTGYDLCTGWGSPSGDWLINALALPTYEITYTIVQPIVNRKGPIVYDGVSASPAIRFEPGDSVIITAGGCVQTGGGGLSWKRYVNPSGPNSDKYYYCTVQVPGLTAGMVPLRNTGGGIQSSHMDVYTINFPQRIPPSLSGQNPNLILGYTDDNYSDNGYWGHDNGTQNQCALVGNAYLKITIIRKLSAQ